MKIGRIRFFHRLPNTSFKANYSIQPALNPSGGKTTAILTLINTPSAYAKILSECSAPKSGFSKNPLLRNHIINLYVKWRVFGYAHHLLDENPHPDLVAWSNLISGYTQNGLCQEAILAFCKMHQSGIKCNEFAFPSVLKARSIALDLKFGQQVHFVIVGAGFECDVFVANTLVAVYAKCWQITDSRRLFNNIPERNVVSWNTLLSSYVQNEQCADAVELFQDMILSRIRPDEFSLSSILNTCTGLEDLCLGRRIHGYLIRLGHASDFSSANALVDMYGKLGDLEDAKIIFEKIARTDIALWNAVIAGCIVHRQNEWVRELLDEMKDSGIFAKHVHTIQHS
ncbi:hypothetical protein ACLOJK_019247 [Asimina triloba]